MTQTFPDWAALLAAGAAEHASPWRNLALATVGVDGAPQARTVVLRHFTGRALDVHTDARSAKFTELQAHPAVTLHGWDPAGRIQLRACGTATLHVADQVADQAWASLSDSSRATYRIGLGPGTPVATPDSVPQVTDTAARGIFCVIRVSIHAVDWLHLAQGSHRRARFTWADGAPGAMWLAP